MAPVFPTAKRPGRPARRLTWLGPWVGVPPSSGCGSQSVSASTTLDGLLPDLDQTVEMHGLSHRHQSILHLPSVASLLRRAAPVVLEGVVMPTVLFYLGMWLGGVWGGIIAALVWSYGALGRRLVVGGVSGLLLLAVATLSMRALVTGLSGSQFVYFVQPLAGEAALGLVFLASLWASRSMTQRLAHDFLPLEGLTGLGLRRVFHRITVLWAAVFLVLGLLSWWMLVHSGMGAYVGYRTALATGVKGAAVVASVLIFRVGLRRHGVRVAFGEAV
jgi:uncharacterized membrane protein